MNKKKIAKQNKDSTAKEWSFVVIIFLVAIICVMFILFVMGEPKLECRFDSQKNICTCFIANRPSQAWGFNSTSDGCKIMGVENESK